jgi:hypothetical protein
MEGGQFQGEQAELTEHIIGVFYAVANELGFGFVESVYRHSTKTFEQQLLHYLRSSCMEVGFVLAFGQYAKFRRVIMTNDRKLPNRLPSSSL